jgi:hypothetical protein
MPSRIEIAIQAAADNPGESWDELVSLAKATLDERCHGNLDNMMLRSGELILGLEKLFVEKDEAECRVLLETERKKHEKATCENG